MCTIKTALTGRTANTVTSSWFRIESIHTNLHKHNWVKLVQWLRLPTLNSADGARFQAKDAVFFIVSLHKRLSLWFVCSDRRVKLEFLGGFPWQAVCYWITMLKNTDIQHIHVVYGRACILLHLICSYVVPLSLCLLGYVYISLFLKSIKSKVLYVCRRVINVTSMSIICMLANYNNCFSF